MPDYFKSVPLLNINKKTQTSPWPMKNVPLVDDGMPIEVGQFKLCVDF